tara:strand:- start:24078 stop:26153 length:2076 start_codon:yes stop_codon:yes gene_type:complete
MSKGGVNSKGFMFLSPYYGKSRTTEILNRGVELDKINLARKQKKEQAKTPKPNNWQPSKNTQKVHAKFSKIFNHVNSQNYDWAVSQGQALNHEHEAYNPAVWAEWQKRLNQEMQLAEFFNEQVSEYDAFMEVYNNPESNLDFSALAYAPLHVTVNDYNTEKNENAAGDSSWMNSYFKEQQILMDEEGTPVPMQDGTNRLQTIQGKPVVGYDRYGSVIEDQRPERLVYNVNWRNVDNMNLSDWTIGRNGIIYYKDKDYHDNNSFVFGEELYKKQPKGINNVQEFITDLPGWKIGDETHSFNGKPKREYINDIASQINSSLGTHTETVQGEGVQVFNNEYASKIYEQIARDYLESRGNYNPGSGVISRMLSNPEEYKLNPGEDSKLKNDWDKFIKNHGWKGTEYGGYNLKNYALYQVLDEWYSHVGAENLKLDNETNVPFTTVMIPSDRFTGTGMSVNAHKVDPDKKEPFMMTPAGEYSYNHLYNHGVPYSPPGGGGTQVTYRLMADNNGVLNAFMEGMPLPNNNLKTSTEGRMFMDNINIDVKGSWQHIDAMVVMDVLEDGVVVGQKFVHKDDIESIKKSKPNTKLRYVPMVRLTIGSEQIKELIARFTEDIAGGEGDTLLQMYLAKLEERSKYTIHVPFEELYKGDNTGTLENFKQSEFKDHIKDMQAWLDGVSGYSTAVNEATNNLLSTQ